MKSSHQVNQLLARLRHTQAQHVLLMLDYDGTLTPIVALPDLAVLTPQRKKQLRKLSRAGGATVAIVSGRAMSDVKTKVGISTLLYAGNHGFELKGPGMHFVHPRAKQTKRVLHNLKQALRKELKQFPGSFVEDKGLTLSIHFRNTPQRLWKQLSGRIDDIIKRLVKRRKIKLTHGKCVLEVRPPIRWGKGEAVKFIVKQVRKRHAFLTPVYIGDDKTDEDAFRAVNQMKGLSILVSEKRLATRAKRRLKDVRAVYAFLSAV